MAATITERNNSRYFFLFLILQQKKVRTAIKSLYLNGNQNLREKIIGIGFTIRAFLPESSELLNVQAGLLTHPGFPKPSHPIYQRQWQVFQKTIIPQNAGSGITAAGTVADSDRVPFSSQRFIRLQHQYVSKVI
jgi:hypothetical protein